MKKVKLKIFVWIDITDPHEQDIQHLEKNFHFHHLALEDSLSVIQHPKLDRYDNYLYLVFHLPRFLKEVNRTVAQEIDVFLGKDYLITLHKGRVKPIEDLLVETDRGSEKIITETPAYLLYELLDKTFDYCFPMLDKIGRKVDQIEDEIYENHSRQTLENIAIIERDIINFRRIINPQRHVIRDLESVKAQFISERLDVYFDDIVDKIERIWDLLNSYKEVVEVLQHTNESIITHRLNEVIKVLTIISVLMLPLTVVTGFYGMNIVGLPFAEHSLASEIIMGILVLIIVAMLAYFKRKRWL